jgi:hypothetical protein
LKKLNPIKAWITGGGGTTSDNVSKRRSIDKETIPNSKIIENKRNPGLAQW